MFGCIISLLLAYRNSWCCAEADAVILIGQLASGCSGNITPVERFYHSRTGNEILKAIRWCCMSNIGQ
jgi:hypothetical protein